ncbi:hypothetical protein PTKIN_Ptkin08bG0076900 [Pterospermum kingtungense]
MEAASHNEDRESIVLTCDLKTLKDVSQPISDDVRVENALIEKKATKVEERAKFCLMTPKKDPMYIVRKEQDPRQFTMEVEITKEVIRNALCDLRASVSIMPIVRSLGCVKNAMVAIGNYFVPIDFEILEMKEDNDVPIVLGRPFLASIDMVIYVRSSKMVVKLGRREFTFIKSSNPEECCYMRKVDDCWDDSYESDYELSLEKLLYENFEGPNLEEVDETFVIEYRPINRPKKE